jgi:putative ABC transport system substrate-binding protein
LLLILFSSWCVASTQTKIAVLFSSDIKPYQESFEGFKDFFADEETTLLVSEYHLEKQPPELIIQQILTANPDLVLTIGPQATMLAKKEIKKTPVIFSMILGFRNINNPNFTGVYLDLPSRIKLENLKRILPEAKRIGVIYSSKFAPVVSKILMECDEMKYQLIGRQVRTGKEFKEAFKDICEKIDYFLMLPDTKIYIKQSVKYLFLEGIRRKLPIIGLSSAFTKAGAFASLESNYYESGKLAGSIALMIKNGANPSNILPIEPEHAKLSINLLVAERLGISIPSHIIEESSEVFGK